ncbi:MAG: rhodanese-like domain-containing protein [Acidobacteriaceae bacterium]
MPAAACSMYSGSRMEYEISPHDLHAKLKEVAPGNDAGSVCLLDVRESWECSTAAIPGSRSIPMGDIPSRANQELDPDAHIVVYCHRGMRSLSVALWLREQGFPRAQSLSGGIDAWAEKIDPSMPRY